MLRLAVVLLSFAIAPPLQAETMPTEIRRSLGEARPLGQGVYRWLGLPLYEATLFAPGGARFNWQSPLALQLVYARSLRGEVLRDATLSELGRIEGARRDHGDIKAKLGSCFRDVGGGDRYVAVATSADTLTFWLNGRKTCELVHKGAKKRILGIWLSEKSRSARLARRLRGG